MENFTETKKMIRRRFIRKRETAIKIIKDGNEEPDRNKAAVRIIIYLQRGSAKVEKFFVFLIKGNPMIE